MLEAGSYTMGIFCRLFGLNYKGMATNMREAEKLGTNLGTVVKRIKLYNELIANVI